MWPTAQSRKRYALQGDARQCLNSHRRLLLAQVHPDRLHTPLATQAMVVLNEAYRQAVLHFTERDANEVIRLDALGLEHVLI